MISRTGLAAVILLCCVSSGVAQESVAAEPYKDDDAYQIYGLLLPHEGSYRGTIVIQQETLPQIQGTDTWPTGPEACVFPEVAIEFKDAIADYNRLNQKRWLLERNFQLERPYEIVNSDTLKVLFNSSGDGWEGFYKRYPGSDGYRVMSAVGFNHDKTLAIVYYGGSCGSLCGSWSFYLLKKLDGKWREVPGVSCHTVS